MKVSDPLTTLHKEAVSILRHLPDLDPAHRTESLRRLAEITVDIRSLFDTDNGEPDWRGKSYRYRQAISDIYAEGALPADVAPTVNAAVRYHVSNVLRARLDDATLDDLGLLRESARERSQIQRAERTDLVHLARGSSRADAVQAATIALTVLRRVDINAVADLTDGDRREAIVAVRQIEQVARDLDRALAPRAKKGKSVTK